MATESALTGTTQNVLRHKLDGIVQQMIANGEPDENIHAVVNDFKGKYFVDAPEPAPSLGSLALTAGTQFVKDLAMAPVNLWRGVQGALEANPGLSPGVAVTKGMLVDPALDQFGKAKDAFSQGRYVEAAGHAGAGVLPVLGPAAAQIGEKAGTGDPTQIAEATGDLGALALGPKAAQMTGRLMQRVGRATKTGGRSAFLRAAKIPESVSKRTATYRKTGDVAAGEQEIANTVLQRGRGAIGAKNTQALRAEMRGASDRIGEAIDTMPGTVPSTPVLQAMAREVRQLGKESDPGVSAGRSRYLTMRGKWSEDVPVGVRQTGGLRDEGTGPFLPIEVVTKSTPRPLTPRELQDFNVAAGQRNAARYAQRGEPTAPAVSRVDMAGSAAGRDLLKSQNPALAAASADFAQLKPAAQAMSKASARIGRHDPVGVVTALLTAGLGWPGLLAYLAKGGPLGAIGQALYDAGGSMQHAGGVTAGLNRQALLAALAAGQREQP